MDHDARGSLLYVDDEPDNRMIFEACLRGRFHVSCVGSGEEALARLARDPSVEVVVADYRMPDMDGLTLLRLARSRAPSSRLVLTSAYSPEAVVESALRDGVVDLFVPKPMELRELGEVLAGQAAIARGLRESVDAGRGAAEGLDFVLLGPEPG